MYAFSVCLRALFQGELRRYRGYCRIEKRHLIPILILRNLEFLRKSDLVKLFHVR